MTKTISFYARPIVILGLLTLGACSNMDETQQKMLSGAMIGTATGAVVTAVTGGCIVCGAAIGGVAGTAGGYLVEQMDGTTRGSSSDSSSGYSNNYNNSAPQGYPPNGYRQ